MSDLTKGCEMEPIPGTVWVAKTQRLTLYPRDLGEKQMLLIFFKDISK